MCSVPFLIPGISAIRGQNTAIGGHSIDFLKTRDMMKVLVQDSTPSQEEYVLYFIEGRGECLRKKQGF